MYSIVGDNDIDVIVVNLHGNPTYVEYMDLDTLDFSKNIDVFLLLACNAGHQNTGSENFAQKILTACDNNIANLIAADGTHFRNAPWHPFRGIRVEGDSEWRKYCTDEDAESMGFVQYKFIFTEYFETSIGNAFKSVGALLQKIGW